MISCLFLKRLFPVGAVAMAVAGSCMANPGSLVGHWHGYGQSETNMRFIVPCVDEIVPSGINRFKALVELDSSEIVPCVFPVDATISNASVITAKGTDQHGHRLLLHGKTRAVGDGSVRLAAFAYKVFRANGGPIDEGHMAMLQMIGGNEWDSTAGAHLSADFSGASESGRMTAGLLNVGDGRTGAVSTMFEGTMSMFGINWGHPPDPVVPGLYNFTFELGGTVGLPAVQSDRSTIAPMAAIGALPPSPILPVGVIAIFTGHVVHPASDGEIIPCVIPGEYRLYDSFKALYNDTFHGTDSSFSQGSFLLTEQG